MKTVIKNFKDGVVNSYSQVFFSNNQWFGLLLILASFVNVNAGISGLIAVAFALLTATLLGFNSIYVKSGSYTFNVLLVGLTMGVFFCFSPAFLIILLFASAFTLFVSVWLSSYLNKYSLPVLSLAYILSIWVLLLGIKSFTAIRLSGSGANSCNEIWGTINPSFEIFHSQFDSWTITPLIVSYLKSMGAIFFQSNILPGIFITLGLLFYSRIAFSLSLLGFLAGYLFFYLFHGDIIPADFHIIGINYILSAIAIGGFFLIPSKASYILVLFCTPILGLIINAFGNFLAPYHLPLYSLPFSFFVLLILYTLNNRYFANHLYVVKYQLFSPEKNLYAFRSHLERFKKDTYIHIYPPFYGEWFISQGHEGKITHKQDFRFAWDFVVTDENKKTFRLPGEEVSDFYCYGLPVLSPAAGTVVTLQDGIDDNTVGDVNLNENWGNTIVIKHSDYLCSKISHIKKDSFTVKVGDYVKKGDTIALCGSSGRSPEPHIHFQLQETKEIGAKTLKYPLSYYVTKNTEGHQLHSFEYPKENETIFRATPTPLIQRAFHFIPGMKLNFNVTKGTEQYIANWEVFTDIENNSYFYCHKTKSVAYFTNNETLFYFNSFSGDKNSLLYNFYLGAHKILLSYFEGMNLEDNLPVETYNNGVMKTIQDFVAPFYIFLKATYKAHYSYADNVQSPSEIKINTVCAIGKSKRKIDFELELKENKLSKFIIKEKDSCIIAENI